MKEILLNNGEVTLIDDEDFEKVNRYKWSSSVNLGQSYNRYVSHKDKNNRTVLLHRFILDLNGKEIVDHIDRNALNNQKYNLRLCTRSQNQMNSLPRGGTSKYKGVSLHKPMILAGRPWRAKITKDYKQIVIGYFVTQEDAAIEYNKKAQELYGSFAYLNEVNR